MKKEEKNRAYNTPIISIITPYYNAGKYIKETAESVLTQTFENFEWIIIDDGSSKEEKKILEEIGKLDTRIKVLYMKGIDNKSLRTSSSKGLRYKKFIKRCKIYCIFRC